MLHGWRAEQKRAQQVRADHERRFAAGVAALKLAVLPLLEKAQDAFRFEGIPVGISTSFNPSHAPQPHVSFECCGSFKGADHGEIELAVSDRALFFHDGTSIKFGLAKSYSTYVAIRTTLEADGGSQIVSALCVVADSFFRDVERRCRARFFATNPPSAN